MVQWLILCDRQIFGVCNNKKLVHFIALALQELKLKCRNSVPRMGSFHFPLYIYVLRYIQGGAEKTHVFHIIIASYIFNIKKF